MTTDSEVKAGWRDIASAPRNGTKIIAYVPGFGMGEFILLWSDGRWREPAQFLGLKVDPTHWMPCPAAPSTLSSEA